MSPFYSQERDLDLVSATQGGRLQTIAHRRHIPKIAPLLDTSITASSAFSLSCVGRGNPKGDPSLPC